MEGWTALIRKAQECSRRSQAEIQVPGQGHQASGGCGLCSPRWGSGCVEGGRASGVIGALSGGSGPSGMYSGPWTPLSLASPQDSSPGPVYFLDPKVTRFGRSCTPAYSMQGRGKSRGEYLACATPRGPCPFRNSVTVRPLSSSPPPIPKFLELQCLCNDEMEDFRRGAGGPKRT